MSVLKHGNVLFELENFTGTEKEGGLYEAVVEGTVPVPRLLPDDRLLLPIDEGVALKVDGEYESGERGVDMNDFTFRFCTRDGSISMIVIEREKTFLMIALENGWHSDYTVKKENGLYRLTIQSHEPCKIYYKTFDKLISLCKAYKALRNPSAVTLKEKAERNPFVEQLFGGGIFWVWNDNYDEIMYADSDCYKNPQTGDALVEIAKELKQEGVDRALFSVFFDSDRKYTEPLYRECGYITTQYDNYNDVMDPALLKVIPGNRVRNCKYTERRLKDYPEGLAMNEDGTYQNAWALKGYDGKMYPQKLLCPKVAMERMTEEVAEVIKEYPYFHGRFIDVYGVRAHSRCFNPAHPVETVEECIEVKRKAFRNLAEMGLITGTEDGFEDLVDQLVYAEGMHSPMCFRIRNSGRRHKNIFDAEEEAYEGRFMMDPRCRVPLWEMVYHENMMAFPYWGDSTDASLAQINRKALFACLFGAQPLYSFSLGNYEMLKPSILSSYRKISAVSQHTAAEPITDYEVLSDDYMVQRTVFGGRYSVTVNFSQETRTAGGKEIPAEGLLFETI